MFFFFASKSWQTHFLTKFNYTNTICGFYITCICCFFKVVGAVSKKKKKSFVS